MSVGTMSVKDQIISRRLRSLGFVHVTGLPLWKPTMDSQGEVSEEETHLQAKIEDIGRWGMCQGLTVANLKNGEVWLLYGEPNSEIRAILRVLCPGGYGEHVAVPCTADGFNLFWFHLMGRMRNPEENFVGAILPDPRPR